MHMGSMNTTNWSCCIILRNWKAGFVLAGSWRRFLAWMGGRARRLGFDFRFKTV